MKSRISLTTFSDDTKRKAGKLNQLKSDYKKAKTEEEKEIIRLEMKKFINDISSEELPAVMAITNKRYKI